MSQILSDFFTLNLNEYDRIGIDLQINKLLLFVFLAFMLIAVALLVYRNMIRNTVFLLSRHKAFSEGEAKKLSDIGLGDSRLVKLLLSRDGMINRVVKRKGAREYTYEEYIELTKKKDYKKEKIDFEAAEFYIKDDMRDRAQHIIEKYETTTVKIVLLCLFIAVSYVCLASCMPELLTLVNDSLEAKAIVNSGV